MELERQTLSIMKACEVVGVSRRTIYNWMAGGKIEYVRTAGGSVRIFADSLWKSPHVDTPHAAVRACKWDRGDGLDRICQPDRAPRGARLVA